MPVYLDEQGNLRTFWKLAAFIVILLPVLIAVNFGLKLIFSGLVGSGSLQEMALNVVITFIPVVIATVFAARVVELAPIQSLGIGFHKGWSGNLASGLNVAGGLIVLLMLGSWTLGQVRIEWAASQTVPARLALTLAMLIVAAAREEILFRGYPLQVLMKGIGPWPAMIAMSCVFGLLHAQNPNSSRLGVFNTIVAGMMLSLAYFRTRSLWFPYGLHLGWNVALGMIAGFPLSGLGVESLWSTHVAGSTWLLGGEYGPEGGVLGTVVFLAGAAAVWKFPSGKIHYDDRFYKDSRAG